MFLGKGAALLRTHLSQESPPDALNGSPPIECTKKGGRKELSFGRIFPQKNAKFFGRGFFRSSLVAFVLPNTT